MPQGMKLRNAKTRLPPLPASQVASPSSGPVLALEDGHVALSSRGAVLALEDGHVSHADSSVTTRTSTMDTCSSLAGELGFSDISSNLHRWSAFVRSGKQLYHLYYVKKIQSANPKDCWGHIHQTWPTLPDKQKFERLADKLMELRQASKRRAAASFERQAIALQDEPRSATGQAAVTKGTSKIESLNVKLSTHDTTKQHLPFVLAAGNKAETADPCLPLSQYSDFMKLEPAGLQHKYEGWRASCKGIASDQNEIGDVTYDKPCKIGNCIRGKNAQSIFHDEYELMALFRKKMLLFMHKQGGVKKASTARSLFAVELYTGDVQVGIIFAVLCIARANPDTIVFALKDRDNEMNVFHVFVYLVTGS